MNQNDIYPGLTIRKYNREIEQYDYRLIIRTDDPDRYEWLIIGRNRHITSLKSQLSDWTPIEACYDETT